MSRPLSLLSNIWPRTKPLSESGSTCFCTLAIHAPYRQRARTLFADAPRMPWIVVTDDPHDFGDLPIRAIRHAPTGPMASDYLERLAPTGGGQGAAAYHDKRFAVKAALEEYETAISFDADSRISKLPRIDRFPAGLAVLPPARRWPRLPFTCTITGSSPIPTTVPRSARCASWVSTGIVSTG